MDILVEGLLSLFQGPSVGGFIPLRFGALVLGTLIGLVIGVLPGLGGVVGLALLLPFTYALDPYMAFALMVGMLAVTTTSDTIPAVFFAVPGAVGSSATVLDGHPMAKRGEAGRAFGAAYMASMLGGIIGAIVLAVSIPILRPILMAFGAPEFFMLGIMGLVMVGSLTGGHPIKGLIAAALGLLMGLVGMDRFNGIPRFAFESLYLWDGVSVVIVGLGLFAVPEIVDMAIKGSSIYQGKIDKARAGVLAGIRDVVRNWFLMLRCAFIGVFLGILPGMGVALINWLAYGHALQSEKNARETFGKGDVRGVIAPEASNNAKEGGSLIPTLAFGIPGSPVMALLLGGFIIQGIVPGPDMLDRHLDITYTMVWSLVIANILATGLCLIFGDSLARLSLVRIHLLAPLIIVIVFLGSYQATQSYADLILLVAVSILGWIMKRLEWPRPPILLGLVLAGVLENNLLISIQAYGASWLTRPIVLILFGLIGYTLFRQVRHRTQQAQIKRLAEEINYQERS